MTVEEYSRNLRGVNDKGNFSPEYLVSIRRYSGSPVAQESAAKHL